MVSRPPAGIASAALVARFSSMRCTAAASAATGCRPCAELTTTSSCGSMRCSAGRILATSSSRRSGVRTRRSRRLKPSSLAIIVAPRRAAPWACVRSLRSSLSGGRDVTAMSTWAMTAVNTLLRSCAMPPASCPTASIFCACRSRSSVRARSATSRCSSPGFRLGPTPASPIIIQARSRFGAHCRAASPSISPLAR